MKMQHKNDCANGYAELRKTLESQFNLRHSALTPPETPDTETCYRRGVSALSEAIEYGAICANMTLAQPFLLIAKESLDTAIKQGKYPSILLNEPPESAAYEKSTAGFCRLVASELLGNELGFDDVLMSISALDEVLTEESIMTASHPRLAPSQLNDWSRYVARYIALHVLCRMRGGTTDESVIRLLRKTYFSKEYRVLIDALLACLDDYQQSDDVLTSYGRVYGQYFTVVSYKQSLVHGFLLSDALLFSSLRFRGQFMKALGELLVAV